MALTIGAVFWGISYFLGPGVQIPSDHILGPDTAAFVHVAPAADDESTRALITSILETLGSIDPESIDEETSPDLRALVDALDGVDMEAAKEILDFFPTSFTMAFELAPPALDAEEATEPGALDFVAALNLASGSRLVRKLIQSFGPEEGIEHPSGDHVILEFRRPEGVTSGTGDYVAFQHDTLLIGTSLAILEETLKRTDFEKTPGPPPTSSMREELDRLSKKWLISGFAGGTQPIPEGLLASLLEDLPESYLPLEERAWLNAEPGSLRFGCGLSGADLTMRVELGQLAEEDLEAVRSGLDRLFEELGAHLSGEGLVLAHETLAGDGAVVLNARLPAFRAWLNDRIKGLAES